MTTEERKKRISAVEQRSQNAIPDLSANPLTLAARHMRQTEYVKNIAPKLKNTLQIFSGRTKETIDNLFGKEMYNGLMDDLKSFNYNAYSLNDAELEKLLAFGLGNWAKSVTNTPSVFLKQVTSFLPYSEGLSLTKYTVNYMKGLSHPRETKQFMNDISPYINVRFKGNEYKEFFDMVKNNDNPSLQSVITEALRDMQNKYTLKRFTDKTLVELGDIISVIYGGYARYQTQLENGMTKEQALKDFETQTVETQQSNLQSMKAHFMRKPGFLPNAAHMFKSQNLQYFNKNMENIIDAMHGDKTVKDAMKSFALYNLLIPLLLTGIQAIINNMVGRKDEDKEYYIKFFLFNVFSNFIGAGLLGHSVSLGLSNFNTLHQAFWAMWGAVTGSPLAWYERAVLGRYDEKRKRYRKTVSRRVSNGIMKKFKNKN
jgi:hypothetical protein